jgi:hypothetical protein
MVTTTSGRKPNYFFVVFGYVLGEDASKPPVEGGVYLHKKGFIAGVSAGDVLLLYQNLGCRGVGVVTGTERGGQEVMSYQYFPLCHPVDWDSLDDLRKTIPELEL